MEWKTKYTKKVRISEVNLRRLHLTKGKLSVGAKLDEILNAYFSNKGGELERKKLKDNIKLI